MRYQECNLLTKIWRRRYYLYIPFQVLYTRIKHRKTLSKFDKSILWKEYEGDAQLKMNWLYTSEEVQKSISDKKADIRDKKLKKLFK